MNPLFDKTLHGAGMWSGVISRGKRLRLTDLEGGANVGMLLYNALERTERYNMPDTLKGQHIFYLRAPYCLHSDMGRLLASITADSVGWHDTVCGHSDAARVLAKYGENNYQKARNDWNRNAHDCFLIELAKWGLGKKDLVPNLNSSARSFPMTKAISPLSRGTRNPATPSSFVSKWTRWSCSTPASTRSIRIPSIDIARCSLEVFAETPIEVGDPSLAIRPENQRAWENNENYHTLRF